MENSRLKPAIYDHIIDYYRFRGLNPEDMYEGAAKLYRVLDEKRGMKKRKQEHCRPLYWSERWQEFVQEHGSVSSDSGAGKLFGFLAVLVIVIALMFLLYRQLYKNHSGLFAQAITAVLLTVSQFIVLMGDFYAPLMGTDAGTGLAVILFLLGGVWIIGVGIAAVVKTAVLKKIVKNVSMKGRVKTERFSCTLLSFEIKLNTNANKLTILNKIKNDRKVLTNKWRCVTIISTKELRNRGTDQ